jgi:hypothetical protein
MDEIWTSGGRFLKEDNKLSGSWSEIEDSEVREKVCRALRDASKKVPDQQQVPRRHKGDQKRKAKVHGRVETTSTKRRAEVVGAYIQENVHFSEWESSARLLEPFTRSPYLQHEGPHQRLFDSQEDAASQTPREWKPRRQESKADSLYNIPAPSPEKDDQFLNKIDAVLGPMSPGGSDPLEKLFDKRRR